MDYNYLALPVEDLISEICECPFLMEHPDINPRLKEIATFQDEYMSPTLLFHLCKNPYARAEYIRLLLENGADPNAECNQYRIKILRPIDAFIEFNSFETEEDQRILQTLLDYGMDINLTSDYISGPEGCAAHFREIKEFCDNYVSQQEALLCKQPDGL